MAKLTPMMQQYMDIKEKYKDCLLFFRLGDFYEMFFTDAETASRELEITLTGRDCGMEERAPMCGVPFHAAQAYISKLINKGYKVAICEQVEDPTEAKGIVKREVVKIVTPGTITELSMLEEKKNNYLMCIFSTSIYYGISVVDISTGEFSTTQITFGNIDNKLLDEIAKFQPSEIVVNSKFYQSHKIIRQINKRFGIHISNFDEGFFKFEPCLNKVDEFSKESNLDGLKENELAVCASGALIEYLNQTQKVKLEHINSIDLYKIEEYMILDSSSRKNLELTETIREKKKKGSLLWILDRTMTSMGGRKLRQWIEQPLLKKDDIQMRLDAVHEFKEKFMVRAEIRELLRSVYDIERLISKVVLGNVNGRDLISLKNSIERIPYIKSLLQESQMALNVLNYDRLDELSDIFDLIHVSITDEPPVTIKEGNVIKDGYNEEVDTLRKASSEGKMWLAELESKEKELTGIKNLKIKFNKVFGYYLEVTKSYFSLVPDRYIRKQTLANGERYITEELKNLEDTILGAEDKIVNLEYQLFLEIRDRISTHVKRVKQTAEALAEVDVLTSLAEVADRNNYCKPTINDSGQLNIIGGRHPVVEKMQTETMFVPNDTVLDLYDNRLAIITGPNMAGKSTYMRQVALMVLMTQVGSFVPADSADIGIADRIFTRVGASDDLASGQSTFMVEMNEVSNILKNATEKSLLILDEIGRGTSTFDGLSIAWSVVEYINDKNMLGARTLFATHYHELTELEDKLNGVKNYCISVKKKGEDIIFLRKIIRGGADESYGIEVAKLAGVPQLVIEKAKSILVELESSDINKKGRKKKSIKPIDGQLDFMSVSSFNKEEREILDTLRTMEVSSLTPLDALNKLYMFQQRLK